MEWVSVCLQILEQGEAGALFSSRVSFELCFLILSIRCHPYPRKFDLHLIPLVSWKTYEWENSTRLCLLGNHFLAKFLVGDKQCLIWMFKPKLWKYLDLINNLLIHQSSLPKTAFEQELTISSLIFK